MYLLWRPTLVVNLMHGDRTTWPRDSNRLYAHAFRRRRKHLYLAQGLIGRQLPWDTVTGADLEWSLTRTKHLTSGLPGNI